MPAHKRKYRSGQVVWHYVFDMSGSTREDRLRITGSGFATSIAGRVPRTLSTLLEEFFCQHVDEKLAPKTIERYHEQAAYLNLELLNMPIGVITPLHLGREWNRLLKTGGHHRGTKEPRPLSAKTVRNIAGVGGAS